LRDKLAGEIDQTRSKRDLALLSARLSEVLQQINSVPKHVPSSTRDEMAAVRARRRADAALSALLPGERL
jgi:hypothetical protein